MSTDNTRDIVIRLETELTVVKDDVSKMKEQVSEMHDLLQQAKGAKWFVVILAAAGGFASAQISTWLLWWK